MKTIIIIIISITLLTASTWHNLHSSNATATNLSVQFSNLESSVLEFKIDGFHLVPVQTPKGEMSLARLEDGASILEVGKPDLHKYSRSI